MFIYIFFTVKEAEDAKFKDMLLVSVFHLLVQVKTSSEYGL